MPKGLLLLSTRCSQVKPCPRLDHHNWKHCPHRHPGEVAAQRRHPSLHKPAFCMNLKLVSLQNSQRQARQPWGRPRSSTCWTATGFNAHSNFCVCLCYRQPDSMPFGPPVPTGFNPPLTPAFISLQQWHASSPPPLLSLIVSALTASYTCIICGGCMTCYAVLCFLCGCSMAAVPLVTTAPSATTHLK